MSIHHESSYILFLYKKHVSGQALVVVVHRGCMRYFYTSLYSISVSICNTLNCTGQSFAFPMKSVFKSQNQNQNQNQYEVQVSLGRSFQIFYVNYSLEFGADFLRQLLWLSEKQNNKNMCINIVSSLF